MCKPSWLPQNAQWNYAECGGSLARRASCGVYHTGCRTSTVSSVLFCWEPWCQKAERRRGALSSFASASRQPPDLCPGSLESQPEFRQQWCFSQDLRISPLRYLQQRLPSHQTPHHSGRRYGMTGYVWSRWMRILSCYPPGRQFFSHLSWR